METIRFKLLPDGGFVAGDTDSTFTAYAYPSSHHAEAAKRNPARVALSMIRKELKCSRGSQWVKDYDFRNWQILNA